MAAWHGKTRGGLTGYKIFIFTIETFGVKSAYFILAFVSFYYLFAAPYASRSLYFYYRSIHGYSLPKAVISIYKTYYVYGQTIIDKICIGAGKRFDYTYTFDGKENLVELAKSGGMIYSAHHGNWDVAGFLLDEINMKSNILMFQQEHENISQYLKTIMKHIDMQIIPISMDMSHVFKINAKLNQGEVICALGDRFIEGSRTVKRTFLGREAWFPLGIFTIAAKKKIPYTFAFAYRQKNMCYALSATPIKVNDSAESILDEYLEIIEKKIEKYPLQWFNFYDFWSQEPVGASKQ